MINQLNIGKLSLKVYYINDVYYEDLNSTGIIFKDDTQIIYCKQTNFKYDDIIYTIFYIK